MPKFRKKPVVIEAMQWLPTDETGGYNNADRVRDWMNMADPRVNWTTENYGAKCTILIKTLEGTMEAKPGDWIIKGVQGEFYPCKPDIFEATYESYEEIPA